MSSGLMWLAIHFCHLSFWLCFHANVDGTKKWKHDGLQLLISFLKKAETPETCDISSKRIKFYFHPFNTMSIERFKASLESCPISISLTCECFHWPVFVLNTIHAVSCVFRGSSFALEIRTCHLLWLYIFFGLIYSSLCWRTKSVCVSVTSSDLLQRLSFPPAEFPKCPSSIYLSVILHIFYVTLHIRFFECDFM